MMIDNKANVFSLFSICIFFASIGITIGDEKIEPSRKKGNGNFKIGPDYKLDPDLKDQIFFPMVSGTQWYLLLDTVEEKQNLYSHFLL